MESIRRSRAWFITGSENSTEQQREHCGIVCQVQHGIASPSVGKHHRLFNKVVGSHCLYCLRVIRINGIGGTPCIADLFSPWRRPTRSSAPATRWAPCLLYTSDAA